MDNKLADNEIIKALECCNKCNTTGSINECCPECPLSDYDGCCDKLIVELAGLFNRYKNTINALEGLNRAKQAEIEQYKKNEKFIGGKCDDIQSQLEKLHQLIPKMIKEAKSEAVKDTMKVFIPSLKQKSLMRILTTL